MLNERNLRFRNSLDLKHHVIAHVDTSGFVLLFIEISVNIRKFFEKNVQLFFSPPLWILLWFYNVRGIWFWFVLLFVFWG